MPRVAYLTSANMVPGQEGSRDDLFELEHQLFALQPACLDLGIHLDLCVWDHPELAARVSAGVFDAVVVGTAWDYHDRPRDFLDTVEGFAARVPVFNPPAVLRWNANKAYLRALEAHGVRVVPTVWVDRVDPTALDPAWQTLGADRVVVKPIVGAGAERQICLTPGEPLPPPKQCPPGAALVQPFIPAIQTEGELSFLFFGGQFSHALVKRPATGDYRVQSLYGGVEAPYSPTPAELEAAQRALHHVPGCTPADLVYARVDLVRAADGGLMLMELELIEPYLYPLQGPGMGSRFASALARHLTRG